MKQLRLLLLLVLSISLPAAPALAQVDSLKLNGQGNGMVVTTGDMLSWRINLPVGGISENELWLDINGNGVVDAATDRLLFNFQQKDGGPADGDAPPDMDALTNGVITTSMPLGIAPARWVFSAKNNGVGVTVGFSVLPLASPQAHVVGQVTGPEGADLRNLIIEAEAEHTPQGQMPVFWQALTDANGFYDIKFPANPSAEYRVRLSRIWGPYMAMQNSFVVMVNETTKTVNFALMQATVIRGLVVTGGQVPVGGVRIAAQHWESQGGSGAEGQTGPDGRYELVVSPGIYRVMFAKAGMMTTWYPGVDLLQDADTIHIEPGTMERQLNTVMMESGAAIRGRVTENGKPLRAEVTAWHRGDFNTTMRYQTWTDDDGTYELFARVELLYIRFMRQDNNDILYYPQTRTPWGNPVTVYNGDVNDLNADFGAVPPSPGWKVITGLVTDAAGGSPLPDVGVAIQEAVNRTQRYNVQTDADGRYTMLVPSGKYFVEYYKQGYQYQAFDHKPNQWTADTIMTTVPGDTIFVPAAHLQRGALIRGRVTKDGMPVNASIMIFRTQNQMQQAFFGHTQQDGMYEVAVAPGSYYVQFQRDMTTETVWFSQKLQPPFDSVTVLTVQDVVENINGSFDPIPPPEGFKIITGQVVQMIQGPAPYPQPLEGVFVNAWPLGGIPTPGLHTMTGPDGLYSLLVPEGLYTVMFSKEGYVPVAFDQKFKLGQGDTVRAIGSQDTIKGINATLEPGAVIQGFCSDSSWTHDPNPTSIFIFRAAGGAPLQLFTGTHTDPSGNYKVLVPPGRYYVRFTRDLDGEVQWYPYRRILDTVACLVNVTSPQEVFNFNVYFSAPTAQVNKVIAGVVTETPSDLPLADVQVFIQDQERLNPPLITTTQPDGSYQMIVPQGNYYVWFQKEWYVDHSYDSHMGPWGSDLVIASVFAPDTIRGINAHMMPGGKIEGRVKNDAGEPVQARVRLHLVNNAGNEYLFTHTDPAGYYRIFAPAYLDYYVQFENDNSGESFWFNQQWNLPADTVRLASTTDVRSNIDATFMRRFYWITGSVENRETEEPIVGALVIMKREMNNSTSAPRKTRSVGSVDPGVFTATTDEFGRYAAQVEPGAYAVSFHKEGYVPRWWAGENGSTTNEWDYWTLYVGMNDWPDSVSYVKGRLDRGGIIQGRVTKDGRGVGGWVMVYTGDMTNGYMSYNQHYVGHLDPRLAGFYEIAVTPGTYYVQFETDSTGQWNWYNNKRNEPYDPVTVAAVDDTVRGINADFTIHDPVEILGVGDVPNDQGKSVFVVWKVNIPEQVDMAVTADGSNSVASFPIVRFSVWRRDGPNGELHTFMQELPYRGDSILYSLVVPTLADSTASKGIFWSTYEVTAHSIFSTVLFTSKTAMGYSVDNILPIPPAGVNGALVGSDFVVSWEPPKDADPVVEYRVYRSTDPRFSPTQATLYRGKIKTTSFTDAGAASGVTYYYVVTAVDDAENEGPPSTLVTNSTVGVIDPATIPTEFSLFQNFPNPFNPSTTIAYDLPEERLVTLRVYSMLGQEIATLVDELKPAGHHSVMFDAKKLASGLYIFKIVAGDFVSIKKMSLVK